MWIVKLKLKHNCIIANRCRQFNVVSYSIPLNSWKENGFSYTSHRHTLMGRNEDINTHIKDLRKDKEVISLEVSKHTIFIVQKRSSSELITSNYDPRMFLVKPVYSDRTGTKYCEFASWKKEVLIDFVERMKQSNGINMSVERFTQEKMDTIYFPKIMPELSHKQAEAFQLAIEHGYFEYPRKINLFGLSKFMKISVSTFQEHLRRAESKMLPAYY